jgi:2-(1,2-epoxy-1,2-dihydrophenyl)acetyl-CoA isomerase
VPEVSVDWHDEVAVLTFGDAAGGNALTFELARELTGAVEEAGRRAGCIVLRSAGPVFCSGADLSVLEPLGDEARTEDVRTLVYGAFQPLVRGMVTAPVPVVARLQGPALGAGADLALACDLRVASTAAWLEESWIRLGTISALGGAHALSRVVGAGTALDLLLTARRLRAPDLLAAGLVQRVTSPEALDDEVMALARQIASADRDAVRAMKELVRGGAELERFDDALARGLQLQVPLIARTTFGDRVRGVRRALASRRGDVG